MRQLKPPHVFGLFVGIEQYQDNIIGNLYCCEDDARDLHQVFKEKTHLTGSTLELLTNEDATRSDILKCLSKFMDAAKADDLILLFVSTHGTIRYNDYFFIPYDGSSGNLLGTGVSASLLINALATVSARGVRVLLIIDTCHAGAISFDTARYVGEFSCLFSASPNEYSYEQYNMENGLFSHFLIEALKKDLNTLREVYEHVYVNVQRQSNKKQNPLLVGTMKDHLNLLEPYSSPPKEEPAEEFGLR